MKKKTQGEKRLQIDFSLIRDKWCSFKTLHFEVFWGLFLSKEFEEEKEKKKKKGKKEKENTSCNGRSTFSRWGVCSPTILHFSKKCQSKLLFLNVLFVNDQKFFFFSITKKKKGKACVALIQQVISSHNIFVFGELLDMPSIQEVKSDSIRIFVCVFEDITSFNFSFFLFIHLLSLLLYQLNGTEHQPYFEALRLFAFGDYDDYLG